MKLGFSKRSSLTCLEHRKKSTVSSKSIIHSHKFKFYTYLPHHIFHTKNQNQIAKSNNDHSCYSSLNKTKIMTILITVTSLIITRSLPRTQTLHQRTENRAPQILSHRSPSPPLLCVYIKKGLLCVRLLYTHKPFVATNVNSMTFR